MFNKIIVVCMFVLVATFTPVSGAVAAEAPLTSLWFNQVDLVDGEVILQPGDMTLCNNKKFTVENISSEPGEVGTIVGSEAIYNFDRMAPGSKMAYSLKPVMPEGGMSNKKLFIEEARIVNSPVATSPLHVVCK